MPYNSAYPASPSVVRQAPDNKALMKTANVVVESQPLKTADQAQVYLEPGINVKLTHRRKPKTNYTTPSDPKSFPLGVVPTNLEGRVAGEEPAIIATKVAHPADLLAVFARIEAEEEALRKLPVAGIDEGQRVANEYMSAIKEKSVNAMMDKLVSEGNSEETIKEAMKLNKIQQLQKKLNGMK